MATIEVHCLSSCNVENRHSATNVDCSSNQITKLASTNITFYLLLLDHGLTTQIPPAYNLVISCGNKNIRIASPNNGLYSALMYAGTNLESLIKVNQGIVSGSSGTIARGHIRADGRKIKDSKLFLHTACRNKV